MNKTSLEQVQVFYSVNAIFFPHLMINRDIWHTETVNKETYHGLFDVLLVVVATCSVVIAVNNLNSDVALRKTGAPFTCGDCKVFLLVCQNSH